MTTPKDIAEGWFKSIGNGDVAGAMQWIGPDTVFTAPGAPTLRGTEQVRAFVEGYLTAFPGAGFTLDNLWEVGQTAVIEGTYTGTHSGPLVAPDGTQIPPTGKSVALPFVSVLECSGGTIRSNRAYWDNAGFMGQLGLA